MNARPEQNGAPIASVAVLGSCVSRDLIRIAADDSLVKVKTYIARSTVRSVLAARPDSLPFSPSTEAASGFEKRNFEIDVDKSAFKRLATSGADICIVDMIDERLSTWQRDGSILVASKGFEAMLGKKLGAPWRLQSSSTTHQETLARAPLWSVKLREALGDMPVVVHRALWADDGSITTEKLAEQNAFLNELYDIIGANLPDAIVVSADASVQRAAEEHMWGTAPFHYVDEYYHDVWNKILASQHVGGTGQAPVPHPAIS
ncbi:DUF6270 domain-containing protein [Ancylobacter sp. Lp-2]|uniref:DUF6270 domain-containing protein n=1 Tax=Ancylobacter sp. Lp-2 TaxID=2881339 RepID=UPI001E45CDEC|nr:DUF6270 domain-containing protein [Ancylobacter sp. Lp-2]MCB4768356.1 DUF6270 domain-containing protein [Ancylobacter sp. Lp-2]